jgi:periplasmic protein TonB
MVPDFDDIIFERLNKEYGAYSLRKRYNRVVSLSVLTAIIIGCAAVLIPYVRYPAQKSKNVYTSVFMAMENMSPPGEHAGIPEPPPHLVSPRQEAAAKIVPPEIKYTAPEVVDTILPFENKMVITADSMAGVMPGSENISGSGNEKGNYSGAGGGGSGGGKGSGGYGVYTSVEVMPKFKGGDINKFREWVQKKTKYPDIATINGIHGKVYITFIVDLDGSVIDVKVAKGVDPLIDDEALKAVSSSPKWTPGRVGGKAVRISYIISVNFEL